MAGRSATAPTPCSSRLSWPGAIRRTRPRSRTECPLRVRPSAFALGAKAIGVTGELFQPGTIVEQVEPFAGDEPHIRVAGDRHAAGDADRVVAAEFRHVDVR